MRTHVGIHTVEVVLVRILAARLRRIDIAPQIGIIRSGAVYDYPGWTAGRHGARRTECAVAG